MKPALIPYGHHWIEEEDIAQVAQTLRSDRITQGPRVDEFERRVADVCGARFGIAFSSGTAALHAACFAAGIGPGDEVMTTPLTFVATANAVVYQGAKPLFADIDPDTLNVDPQQIRRRLTTRTKVLLPVHFAGLPADMEEISKIARERDLTVIEDACHALGAQWRDAQGNLQRVGSCSHSAMAVFSFHPVKQITTAEGGMVLTQREDLKEKLQAFRHHGILRNPREMKEPWRYEMHFLGFNYRLSDVQCALGLKQIERLNRFLERRRAIAESYKRAFEDMELIPQQGKGEGGWHAWHLYVTQLKLEELQADRREIFCALQAAGIGVQVHYLPVHLHPFYQKRFGYCRGDYPTAERYYERALTLPLYPKMTDGEVQTVIEAVHRVLSRCRRPNGVQVVKEPASARRA